MLVTTFCDGCGCNHLIMIALLVCNMKQSTCVRDFQQFFLNPDQNNESIHTNHLLSQVFALHFGFFIHDVKKNKIKK